MIMHVRLYVHALLACYLQHVLGDSEHTTKYNYL